MKNNDINNSVSRSGYYSNLKKLSEQNFKQQLFEHPQYNAPQSLQGMWQAYGQMRAARISGRYALATTGIIGTGLFFYKEYLNFRKKQLCTEIIKHETTVANCKILHQNTLYALKIKEQQFALSDNKLRRMYIENKDNKSLSTYEDELIAIKYTTDAEINLKINKLKL